MSGHSKWHNIKLRKQAQDQRKSKVFAKISREIMAAARAGGGDPDTNIRLRTALEKARSSGMPQDNVKRAIQKGTGELGGAQYESLTYEGYAPGGVAMLIQMLTDNKNRTVGELRSVLTRNGGNLAESNAVAWLFHSKGVAIVAKGSVDEDTLLETALDAGAEDMQSDENSFEIRTAPADLEKVKKALEAKGIAYESAEVTMLPQTRVTVEGKQAQQVLKLMDALDELEDVQQVYANFDIPDEIMEQIAA